MDATTLKTRHGLILQGAVAEALRKANLSFKENWQYDPTCERPDFTIPEGTKPNYVVEVHQTDARDSFRMKILRAFNAVTEAKVFFGESIISVNILFGDPDNEVPESNVKALFGFFDVNIIPRKDASNSKAIISLENFALSLAGDESLNVSDATAQVIGTELAGIDSLSKLLASKLATAKPVSNLLPVWKAEALRVKALGTSPSTQTTTHYKRAILQSLFLSNDHFAELNIISDSNKYSTELKQQLVVTGLAEAFPSIRGSILVLNPILREFIGDVRSAELRELCANRLKLVPAMNWFFEDLRSLHRRTEMANYFKSFAVQGRETLIKEVAGLLENPSKYGIEHERNWLADFLPLVAKVSQNEFNRRMVQSGRDPENYQYPFNHITGRFERLINSPNHFQVYAQACVDIYFEICKEVGINPSAQDKSIQELSEALIKLRLDGAVKLQRFNPLYEVIEAAATSLGLATDFVHSPSFLFDLAGGTGRLGKNDLIIISDGSRNIAVNALYIGESYGSDHKADEWSARRRSLGYRIESGSVQIVNRAGYIFIVDGVWAEKSVKKLHAAGWTHVIRLSELEVTLKSIFNK